METLLEKVKVNLSLGHNEHDALLENIIKAAVDYAEGFQKVKYDTDNPFPPATEQAIIMLSSHFYESRDGSTGGFFSDSTAAGQQIWVAVNRLLQINKYWEV